MRSPLHLRHRLLSAVRLETITRRVDDKGRIIGFAIIGAQARSPVVAPPGFDRRRMESIDRCAARRVEADMQT